MKQLIKNTIKRTIPSSIKNKIISIMSRIVSEQINLYVENIYQKLASLEKVEYKVKELEQGIERASETNVFSDEEYDTLEKYICRGRKIVEKDYFDSLSENFAPKTKILDLGCGDGSFIKQMNQKGFFAQGIDASTKYAGQPYVTLGLLPEALKNIPDNSYDVITSFHLIEHLPLNKYKEMIIEVYRILKKCGKVFFETPNTQSLITMSQYYYKDPTHLMPRHPEVYKNILDFNGFKNTEITNLPELDPNVFELISEEDSLFDERDLSIVNKKISKIENILVAGSGNILIVGEK